MEYSGEEQPVMRSRLRFVSSEYGRGNGQALRDHDQKKKKKKKKITIYTCRIVRS
jgi:hypothetical protein